MRLHKKNLHQLQNQAEMKTPSSSKSFQPTLTGTSTNKSGLLTKVTPGKRVLDFLSAVSHLKTLHMVGGKF